MLQIGQYILRGELRNTQANSVYGWLEFAPDRGVHIELTGNLTGQLQSKHIKFSVPAKLPSSDSPKLASDSLLPEVLQQLAERQIGVIGDVSLEAIHLPTLPEEGTPKTDSTSAPESTAEQTCLHIEWYSQNGRVLAEIIDPELEYIDPRHTDLAPPPDFEPLGDRLTSEVAETYLDIGGHELLGDHLDDDPDDDDDDDDLEDELLDGFDDQELDEDLQSELDDDSEGDDPYGLFDADLDRSVAQSLGANPDGGEPPDASHWSARGNRSWDEVLPGIDPETKAMYEQWDEIFEGKKDEPVAYLFEKPLRLPPPERVQSDEEAQQLVVSILAQLALLSVAVDVCEHFTPLQTYHLLMTEILPTAKVHPNLAASRMVQHYSTSDHCAACEAYYEAQYRARKDREQSEDNGFEEADFDESTDDVNFDDEDESY